MDDILQPTPDFPVRKLPRVRKTRQDSFREEDGKSFTFGSRKSADQQFLNFAEEEYSAKFLEDVLEEEEDESGDPKAVQTVNNRN